MRSRSSKDENGEAENIELSVYDYFVKTQGRKLQYSAELPCINVGKPKRPTYFPIEVEFSSLLLLSKQLYININLGYPSLVLHSCFAATLHKGINCYSEIITGRKVKTEASGKDKYPD